MSPLIHNQTTLPLQPGKSLFDYADDLAVRVPTSCNRTGECHECIVEVRQGTDAISPLTDAENFLRDNYRLACQATVVDIEADIEFNILRRQPRILTESIARDDIELDPLTVREGNNIIFKGEPAPFANSAAPFAKRKGARKSEAIFAGDAREGPRVVDRYRGRILGIAADIGTTTVAMNLVDLETGDILYTASFENPQRFGGSDVMNRISYDTGTYRGELQAVLISSINYEIGEMVRALKIRRRHIVEFVAVGNTTMRDILFGIDVEPVGQKPYKSHIETDFTDGHRDTTALNALAHELGIRINPNANIYSGPLIASHIGSDIAADLLTIAIDQQQEPIILIDIGTNTEIIAGNKDQLHAASCPAGPAFEGGQVTYAMPGYNGAVEHVVIPDEGTFRHSGESRNPEGKGAGESPLPRNLPTPSQGEIKRGYRERVTGPAAPAEQPLSQSENNPVGAGLKPAPTTEETLETSRHPDAPAETPLSQGERGASERSDASGVCPETGGDESPLPRNLPSPSQGEIKRGYRERVKGPGAAAETPLPQTENNPVGAGFKPAPATPEDHALSRHLGDAAEQPPSRSVRGRDAKRAGDAPLLSTIGNTTPIGICGSGLIDLLAELRRHNIMNELGNFNDGSDEFTFHHENRLTISRADISALAQAKAANYCGQNIVLETTKTTPDDYTRLYLAGGFANYINIQNAIDIGFIPNIPPDRITKIGNASLQGATIMLTNATKRATIETLATTITHIELETNPNFFDHFVEGCQFKK